MKIQYYVVEHNLHWIKLGAMMSPLLIVNLKIKVHQLVKPIPTFDPKNEVPAIYSI